MYLAHFGLKDAPFKITPNTDMFFTGANRGAVLDALLYAITSGEGIVKVVGEVGSGKTMLCRMLQANLPPNVESIYLAIPSVAPEHVLQAIAFELKLKLPKSADKLKTLQILQSYLVNRHESGKQVVIFVEEAQAMPLATLEEIRLLSNLETKHDKLLQIVLFGQPELDENLNETHIRQLRERITHSFHLGPLKLDEIGDYLIFRLRSVGFNGPPLFDEKAVKLLAQASEGLVRRVNILADKAMLAAFSENKYQVLTKHAKAAILDSEFGETYRKQWRNKQFLLVGLALGLACVLAFLAYQHFWHSKTVKFAPKLAQKQAVTQPQTPKKAAPMPQQNIAQRPYAEPVKPAEITSSQAQQSQAQQSQAQQNQAPAQMASAQLNTANPTSPSTAPVGSVLINPAPTTAPNLLEQRIIVTQAWLTQQLPETVTIQLLGSADEAQLIVQLENLSRQLVLDNLYVYRTHANSQPFFTVLYGGYADRQQAATALKLLPLEIQKFRPQLRTIQGVLQEVSLVR